jgi:hypothetical protein
MAGPSKSFCHAHYALGMTWTNPETENFSAFRINTTNITEIMDIDCCSCFSARLSRMIVIGHAQLRVLGLYSDIEADASLAHDAVNKR